MLNLFSKKIFPIGILIFSLPMWLAQFGLYDDLHNSLFGHCFEVQNVFEVAIIYLMAYWHSFCMHFYPSFLIIGLYAVCEIKYQIEKRLLIFYCVSLVLGTFIYFLDTNFFRIQHTFNNLIRYFLITSPSILLGFILIVILRWLEKRKKKTIS